MWWWKLELKPNGISQYWWNTKQRCGQQDMLMLLKWWSGVPNDERSPFFVQVFSCFMWDKSLRFLWFGFDTSKNIGYWSSRWLRLTKLTKVKFCLRSLVFMAQVHRSINSTISLKTTPSISAREGVELIHLDMSFCRSTLYYVITMVIVHTHTSFVCGRLSDLSRVRAGSFSVQSAKVSSSTSQLSSYREWISHEVGLPQNSLSQATKHTVVWGGL